MDEGPGGVDPDFPFPILERCFKKRRGLRASNLSEGPGSPETDVRIGILKQRTDVADTRGISQPAEDPRSVEPDIVGHRLTCYHLVEHRSRCSILEIGEHLGSVQTNGWGRVLQGGPQDVEPLCLAQPGQGLSGVEPDIAITVIEGLQEGWDDLSRSKLPEGLGGLHPNRGL